MTDDDTLRYVALRYVSWLDVVHALDDVDRTAARLRPNYAGGGGDGLLWDTDGNSVAIRRRGEAEPFARVTIARLLRTALGVLTDDETAALRDTLARMDAAVADLDDGAGPWLQARADADLIWRQAHERATSHEVNDTLTRRVEAAE